MHHALVSIEDLTDADVSAILSRATEFRRMQRPSEAADSHRVVGLLFLETSLRTRAGFAVAAARLGWYTVEVSTQRESPTSSTESVEDTLRTLSGLVDVLVARPGVPVKRGLVDAHVASAFINAGDTGPEAEHPTQALIELYAMERWVGPLASSHVGICGDPRMRAGRSLLRLLSRRRPRRISLYVDPSHGPESVVPSSLGSIVEYRTLEHVDDLDVLYVVGMPHASLSLEGRQRLIVTRAVMSRLPAETAVLSPLPLIDEIEPSVRGDRRLLMFRQSDEAVFVRMALLERITRAENGRSAD